jgi:P-type Cu+ transporter
MNSTVTDPICGMSVDPAKAAGSSTYDGQTYHFCSTSCESKFDAAPALYVGTATTTAPTARPSCACC